MPVRLTRRRLLQSGASLLALAGCSQPDPADTSAPKDTGTAPEPSPTRSPEPAPWDAPGEEDAVAFARGMQVGDVTDAAAVVSIRADEEALVLVLMREAGEAWEEALRSEPLSIQDGGLQLELDDLEPDTAYTACFFSEDGARRCAPTRFRSAPSAGTARVVTFGATSCLGGNRPWPNLTHAAGEDFDFFLLLGDTVYADGALTRDEYRAFWDEALSTQGLRDLFARTSVVATWDDHEVGNGWTIDDEGMEEQAATALAAFAEAVPKRAGGGWAGIWRSLRWGDTLEVFVLECRGEVRDGNYISPEQMAWLKDALLQSPARFKIVANSVPITDFAGTALGDIMADERWQGYPAQRTEILTFIRDNAIGGVLWVTGDFHFGALARIDAPGGTAEDAWEVLAGPSGSTLNPICEVLDDAERFPVMFGAWNYTRFVADPGLGTIAVQWIGDDGSVLYEMALAV